MAATESDKKFITTNSGQVVSDILMEGEDEGERVLLVKYQSGTQQLRSSQSFRFLPPGYPKAKEVEKEEGRVLVSVVGINVDVKPHLEKIQNAIQDILTDIPFTIKYDHFENEKDSNTTEAPSLDIDDIEETTSAAGSVVNSPVSEKKRKQRQSEAHKEIIEELTALEEKEAKPSLLNPFGEPITDEDIMYAFEKWDENNDRKLSLKEFKKAIHGLGLFGYKGTKMTDVQIKKLFKDIDVNDDKQLDLEEFMKAVNHMNPKNNELWNKMLTASEVDLKPKKGDPDIDKIAKLLKDKKADWSDRIDFMHALLRKCMVTKKKKKFDALLRPTREPLCVQLTDRRSAVVRECCICIAKICLVRQELMTRWAPRLLECLFMNLRLNVEIMSVSAHQTCKAIIKCVPDDKKKLELLSKLIKGTTESYVIVREKCFEYLQILVKDSRVNGVKRGKRFWERIYPCVSKGLQDGNNKVRKQAAMCASEMYCLYPEKTDNELIKHLRRATKKVFLETLSQFISENKLEVEMPKQ